MAREPCDRDRESRNEEQVSNNKLALSTANLYNLAVPGGSLFGLNESNPYNPFADDARIPTGYTVPGGIITFGGGVPLYEGTRVNGGLGVSGDPKRCDHAPSQ